MRARAWLGLALIAACTAGVHANPAPMPGFAEHEARLRGARADELVMELQGLVELIASRGSAMGTGSNRLRVEGFEAHLLSALQATHCKPGALPTQRPWPGLPAQVAEAARTQRLPVVAADLPELTALVQLWAEQAPPRRWCGWRRLQGP